MAGGTWLEKEGAFRSGHEPRATGLLDPLLLGRLALVVQTIEANDTVTVHAYEV